MQAVILVGGEGTRLRPLTSTVPKPVVPLVDRPFIAYMLEWLARHGVDDVVMSCGFLATSVRNVLGDGARFGVRLRFVEEPEPRGTAGALKYAERFLDERFLMLNGDVLTDLDYAGLVNGHAGSGAPITVATYDRTVRIDFGVLEVGGLGGDHIVAFREKPVESFSVSMGIYALSRETLRPYSRGEALGFDELVLDLLRAGDRPPRVHPFDGYWLDIGRPDDYDTANEEWETLRPKLLPTP